MDGSVFTDRRGVIHMQAIHPWQVRWLMSGSLLLLMAGCQSPFAEPAGEHAGGYIAPSPMVFDAPILQHAMEPAELQRGLDASPWYVSRRDARLITVDGFDTGTYEQAVNITIDTQRTSGDRLSDQYRNTTYRQQVTGYVR
jgi:hypothetical protein